MKIILIPSILEKYLTTLNVYSKLFNWVKFVIPAFPPYLTNGGAALHDLALTTFEQLINV